MQVEQRLLLGSQVSRQVGVAGIEEVQRRLGGDEGQRIARREPWVSRLAFACWLIGWQGIETFRRQRLRPELAFAGRRAEMPVGEGAPVWRQIEGRPPLLPQSLERHATEIGMIAVEGQTHQILIGLADGPTRVTHLCRQAAEELSRW